MITPEEILRKAQNLYGEYLAAWLSGDTSFFPRSIPCRKTLSEADHSQAIQAVRNLREGSHEVRGYGYTVRWREVNSRRFGRNMFPQQISFVTRDDYLRFINKQREFDTFALAVEMLRENFPELEAWIRSHPVTIVESAAEFPGLIEVLQFFRQNPRPDRFARELPLSVDTKFIERHQGLLREWFDLVLPPATIRSDEEHFERRYGLRYSEPHLCIRLLDRELVAELGFPGDEISLPLHTLSKLQPRNFAAVIVENRTNLLTLPPTVRGIGLGGLGKGVTLLRHIPWLADTALLYWGDLDVDGFEILSSCRALFPRTQSLLMDRTTLGRWPHLTVVGNGRTPEPPAFLTPAERAAFEVCREKNLRLEQERIPQSFVAEELKRVIGAS